MLAKPWKSRLFDFTQALWDSLGLGMYRLQMEQSVKLDHPGLVTLKLSGMQILRKYLELVSEWSIVVLKSGTDRLGTEGKVKEFREIFFLRCPFETFRPIVLIVG